MRRIEFQLTTRTANLPEEELELLLQDSLQDSLQIQETVNIYSPDALEVVLYKQEPPIPWNGGGTLYWEMTSNQPLHRLPLKEVHKELHRLLRQASTRKWKVSRTDGRGIYFRSN